MARDVEGVYRRLHGEIRKLLVERGFTKPTDIQEAAIPKVLEGKNVLMIAPTGTGKTEAALLPVLHKMVEARERGEPYPPIAVLYITPLRALNRDLLLRISWWCEKLGFRVGVRHGDTDASERARQSRNPPDILITTPEMLQAILTGKVLRSHIANVRWVIVDEVHELAEDKRGSQLALTLERLRLVKFMEGKDPEFQVIGLSATVGSPKEVAKFLVGTERDCEVVKVEAFKKVELKVIFPKPTPEDFELAEKLYTHPEVAARLRVIRKFVEGVRSALIFVNTRSIAEVLASRFQVWDPDFPILVHHGSLSKVSREYAERALRDGKVKALIATSSLELGIDIGHVDLVIQYMSPRQVTRLVQRVGRSGHRIGRVSRGVIITDSPNDTLEALVICKRAVQGMLEPIEMPEKPLDVLCHQIVGFLMLYRRWCVSESCGEWYNSEKDCYCLLQIVRRAYPYRNLTVEELDSVLRYMHERRPRLAWYAPEDGVVLRPRNTRGMYEYYFEEMSMIPDEKQYLVVNMETDEPLGILDESFVAEYGQPGIKFIFRGSLWRLVTIKGDRIFVEPAKDPVGAVPSWVGEEIPVPFEIAQEVGRIKRVYAEMRSRGLSVREALEEIMKEYPYIELEDLARALEPVEEQLSSGAPVPNDRHVLIEVCGDIVVVHAHFGTKVNRGLGMVLGDLFTRVLGHAVNVEQDPYSIVIYTYSRVSEEVVREVLHMLFTTNVLERLADVAKRSGLFKRRLVHVARRFGALEKEVSVADISSRRLIEMFYGTPIYEEALKEFYQRDVDASKIREVVSAMKSGSISVTIIESSAPTRMSKDAIEKVARKTEVVPPERLRKVIIESVKARVLNESRVLTCLNCLKWIAVCRARDLPDEVKCPVCGSKLIGVSAESQEKVAEIVERVKKGRRLNRQQERIWRHIQESAKLVEKYGKAAVIALCAKGVRPEDVAELLERVSDYRSDEFYELLAKLEKEALKRFV